MSKAASVKDLLAQAKTKKQDQNTKCHTCKWLTTLNPEEAQLVQEAIHSGEWDLTVLSETLKPAGFDVNIGAFHHHKRQQHQIPFGR